MVFGAVSIGSKVEAPVPGRFPMLQIVRYHKGGPEGPHGCCLSWLRSSASIAVLKDDATLDMPGIDARELFNAGMQVIQKESPDWGLVFLGGSLEATEFTAYGHDLWVCCDLSGSNHVLT